MSRVAYVDGQYVPFGAAAVHIEDRGLQFADGVYEVWSVRNGRLLDLEGHLARLERSLGELRIKNPMGRSALQVVLKEVLRRNRVRDGLVYLQVTRGVSRRDHVFPPAKVKPTVIVTARLQNVPALEQAAAKGAGVITVPESRWARCDIKTVGLLPNVLAKQAAKDAGAQEAWFVDAQGFVTEGSSTNAWIIDATGAVRTRDTSANILRGITRARIIEVLKEENLKLDETPFTLEEAYSAREAFYTAATAMVTPVTSINGRKIGDGAPGRVAARLRAAYLQGA
ncbi:MAG: D-amino-acid transaminase [Caulobacterales bacterium]